MKTIGLLGGMSWESTAVYYSMINNFVNGELHGNHSAKCVMYSFDFQEIENLQYSGNWERLEVEILNASSRLRDAGADCIVLCTNTMHKVADSIEKTVGLPLLHIADAVGEEIRKDGKRKVGLLGTIFTMEQDFYRGRLKQNCGIETIIPSAADMATVNSVIYEELVKGVIRESSRAEYRRIMDDLVARGAEGIILGCTEIGLLIDSYSEPLYDSTIIHARKAVNFCLGN